MKTFLFVIMLFTSISAISEESTDNTPTESEAYSATEGQPRQSSYDKLKKTLQRTQLKMVQFRAQTIRNLLGFAIRNDDTKKFCAPNLKYQKEIKKLEEDINLLERLHINLKSTVNYHRATIELLDFCNKNSPEEQKSYFSNNKKEFQGRLEIFDNFYNELKIEISRRSP